ncbi:MAG: hypothetical protein WHV66_05315 [Anaerolineales bacterium]
MGGLLLNKKYLAIVMIIIAMVSLLAVGGNQNDSLAKAATEPPPPVASGAICLNRGTVPDAELHWLYIPESAAELATEENYLYLAGRLIESGVVDASDCPAGGMGAGGYANACGLAAAKPVVIELQNAYDEAILQAWQDVGVPPVLLKQLIRYESQFWPGQWGTYHFGLSHLTYYGAYTALYWSPVLFQRACDPTYGGRCEAYFIDAMMIGSFLQNVNADCPTCPYKIDIAKAQKSINYIAHALLAYCRQTAQIVSNATGQSTPGAVVDYATIWKLTLYNYNAGSICLYNAVRDAYESIEGQITWLDIAGYVGSGSCELGVGYVNKITEPYYAFPPGE